MATYRALVLRSRDTPFQIEELPKPQATSGSVVVRILAAPIAQYTRDVFDGTRLYGLTFPMVPGLGAIGCVEAVADDAVALELGQLVYCDGVLHGRDDNDTIILHGWTHSGTSRSKKLIEGEWRDGTFAEYCKFPLEMVFALDENRLFKELHYTPGQLIAGILPHLTAFGGLDDIGLSVGETIIVAPSTGTFSGAAVAVALALGANVIAAGRTQSRLDTLADSLDHPRLKTIVISTKDAAADAKQLQRVLPDGQADCFIDFSPPAAAETKHIEAALLCLRRGGRVSLMGGIQGNISLPHKVIMRNNLKLQGTWMYSREQIIRFLRLVQNGILKLDVKVKGTYDLDQMANAIDVAASLPDGREQVVLVP